MAVPIASQRVLVGVAANVDVILQDQDGEPAAAGGTVTVDVAQADGTVVATAGATTAISGVTGGYRYALAAQSALALLSFTWKVGGVTRITTLCDVVGGYYFTVAQVRTFDLSLADSTKYPNPLIQARRREVEDECEWITRQAWVPRYRRRVIPGTGSDSLRLGVASPRTIRTVRVYNPDQTTYTLLTATELAALRITESGVVTRMDGSGWPAGQNITIEYEYGNDRPPSDLQHATLTRLRGRLNAERTGIPDRATSFTVGNAGGAGGVFTLATPGQRGATTGIPEVDATYERYAQRRAFATLSIT